MLQQTAIEMDELGKKLVLLSGVIGNLRDLHKEFDPQVDRIHKEASAHKIKLLANILKLVGTKQINEILKP